MQYNNPDRSGKDSSDRSDLEVDLEKIKRKIRKLSEKERSKLLKQILLDNPEIVIVRADAEFNEFDVQVDIATANLAAEFLNDLAGLVNQKSTD
jgi:hypothetical protein